MPCQQPTNTGEANFTDECVAVIQLNLARIASFLDQSLMLVTALSAHIGYDNTAKISKLAYSIGGEPSLKSAALDLGLLTSEEFGV